MENLLKETIKVLKENGKKPKDIRWVGTAALKSNWENFKKVADRNYDSGFGAQLVARNILIVGDNWWLERGEYDGSEWWEFKTIPQEPSNEIIIEKVIGGMWKTLEELNGL